MIRNNLRKRARVSYFEPEDHDLDEYIFCSQCGDYVVEYCAVHGALLVIPDTKVSMDCLSSPQIPYAALTIPGVFLHIAPSVIPDAGLGVFTTLALPEDVRFGPYVGDTGKNVASPYCWQIYSANRTLSHVVDASNPNRSNWMRYVNCSRHWNEQNLIAYQYRGEIYYRTLKIIPRNTELLVYYGTEYAKELGIDIRGYNDSRKYINYITKTVAKDNNAAIDSNKDVEEVTSNKLQTEEGIIKIHFETDTVTFEEVNNNTTDSIINENIKYDLNDVTSTVNEYNGSKHEQIQDDSTINNVNNLFNSDSNCIENQFNNLENNFMNKHIETQRSVVTYTKSDNHTQINNNAGDNSNIIYEKTDKSYFKCQNCNYHTYLEASFKNHMKLHDPNRHFECYICHYKYIDRKKLKRHIDGVHFKKFKCNICNIKFSKPIYLKNHLVNVHNDSSDHKLHKDNSNLNSYDNLQSTIVHRPEMNKENMHIDNETKTPEDLYAKCDICGYKTISEYHFKIHIQLHEERRQFSCHICNFRYTHQYDLKRHITTVHKAKNEIYSKEVKTESPIDESMTKDTTKVANNSLVDGKRTKNDITSILITHEDAKETTKTIKSITELINKLDKNKNINNTTEANNNADLKYTENIFTFHCKNCDFNTPSEYAIKKHVNMHDSSRKFVCHDCNYRFKRGVGLSRHIESVHNGEKAYKCNLCDAKYAGSYRLKIHMMQVHKC